MSDLAFIIRDRQRNDTIRRFILQQIDLLGKIYVGEILDVLGEPRSRIYKVLKELESDGVIESWLVAASTSNGWLRRYYRRKIL